MVGCICLYLLYGLLSAIFLSGISLDSYFFVRWVTAVSVYICVRFWVGRQNVLKLLVVIGGIQAILAIMQQCGYYCRDNYAFQITGFFSNPGPMGGFQAISLVAGLYLLGRSRGRRYVMWGYILAVVAIGYSLLLSDSRAAMLACITGVVVLFWKNVKEFLAVKRIRSVLIMPLIIIFVTILVIYRPKSASARLLMWRVTAEMIVEKPLFGFGVGQFDENYQLYQAKYFEDNPDSDLVAVADNVGHPYNEFLHVLAEQGVMGGVLFLVLLLQAFRRSDRCLKAIFSALIMFSMFSYPSYVDGMFILFPVMFGLIERGNIGYNRCLMNIISVVLLIISASLCLREYNFLKKLDDVSELSIKEKGRAFDYYIDNFDRIKYYPDYNIFFSSLLDCTVSSVDRNKLESILPTSETWCNIGDYYKNRGMDSIAVEYYRTASFMVPTRIMPNYKLWNLFVEKGNFREADEYAEKIMSQPVKVENTVTLSIKGEVLRYLGDRKL